VLSIDSKLAIHILAHEVNMKNKASLQSCGQVTDMRSERQMEGPGLQPVKDGDASKSLVGS
jgi:hypothetical protein